ncbi:LytR/AlgR family response regulator transcription factor [Persicitalea sp.]|uniref:LytR/AlgR family response regulator transcription factor n=1 Tax=Persicitalea sp. TaxID=3100273 RepID=UPI0035939022
MNYPPIAQEPSVHIGAYTSVPPTEIIFCEGDRNYTHVHFAHRPMMTLSVTMRVLHERLGEANFLRVNRSALVNKAAIAEMDADAVVLHNGLVLPVARRRLSFVRRSLEVMKPQIFLLLVFATTFSEAQNLIKNPDCELPLIAGKISFWTEALGTNWTTRSDDPTAQSGSNYFFAGEGVEAELSQTIQLDDYKCSIDPENQRFNFTGYTRSWNQKPTDESQIIIEMLNANDAVLQSDDLGTFNTISNWNFVSKSIQSPALTKKIKIRLLSHRKNGDNNDGYFDSLSLVAEKNLPATITVKSGNWNDPTVWLCGQVPGSTDAVVIRHVVALPGSYTAHAGQVAYEAGGSLSMSTNGKLQLGN